MKQIIIALALILIVILFLPVQREALAPIVATPAGPPAQSVR